MGFQPEYTRSKTNPRDIKALLQEDINQSKNDRVANDDDDRVFKSMPKITAVMPGIQRQRPLLVRAAKAAQKVLREDSSNEEDSASNEK